MNQSMLENQIPEINNSEKLRLTSRQRRILQVVNQSKPLNELAYELGTSRDAAKLLEDIAVRLNHRLNININHQLEKQQDQQQPKQLQTKEAHNSIDNELLTPRQCEVLRLVANGLTTKEIAKSLFISVKTVETHRGQVMQRLNIHDLAGLIRYAIRVGLISIDD
jgi:DNA-binding NarL/FixJ family response regulator